nr:hypothetical protein [Tanacetum cinerariifolium]
VIGWCVPDTPSHGADPSTHVTIKGSSGLRRFFRYDMFIDTFYLCYSLSLYPFTERYAQPYFFSCLIRQTFKTLCLLNYALMIRHDYDITSSLRRGALQLWYQSQRGMWASNGISQPLDLSGATYTRYFEAYVPYQRRRVRQRTDGASTSAPQ